MANAGNAENAADFWPDFVAPPLANDASAGDNRSTQHRSIDDRGIAVPAAIPESQRSQFVTVIAWIFIVLGGFTTLISLLQNILVNTVIPLEQMQAQMATSPTPIPPMVGALMEHIRLFFFAFLVLASTTLVSAVGLLRRRNWARRIFIAILALGILWNIAGLFLQQTMMSEMQAFQPPGAPADIQQQMRGMMAATQVFSAIFALGFSLLFGWIIKRLTSPGIVAEFE